MVGFFSLVFNFILKFVPDRICLTMGDEEEKDVIDADVDY